MRDSSLFCRSNHILFFLNTPAGQNLSAITRISSPDATMPILTASGQMSSNIVSSCSS